MRRFFIAALIINLLAAAIAPLAQASAALAEGQIRKVDRQKGLVVIAHGPLPNGMPAMTMPFRPHDPKWLEQLQEGQKIRFAVEDANGTLILQHYEAAK